MNASKPTKTLVIGGYFTRLTLVLLGLVLVLSGWLFINWLNHSQPSSPVLGVQQSEQYWFVLYRQSNLEQLFLGQPGNFEQSQLIKTFKVKTGIPGQRPTPLPQLVGREYWQLTKKYDSSTNPETAPYFLELDVPGIEQEPYGPTPYLECDGQCNWQLPGAFGLHGVNGDPARLGPENMGSSGCVRHRDEDITYLYNLLDLSQPVRYYVHDL